MVPLSKTLRFILSGKYILNKGKDCHSNIQCFLLGQFPLLLEYLWGQYCHPSRTQYNIENCCDVDHMIGHPRVNENCYYFINSNVLFNLEGKTIFERRVKLTMHNE